MRSAYIHSEARDCRVFAKFKSRKSKATLIDKHTPSTNAVNVDLNERDIISGY